MVVAHSRNTRCRTLRNEGCQKPTGTGFDSMGLPSAAGPPTSGTQSFFFRDRNNIANGVKGIQERLKIQGKSAKAGKTWATHVDLAIGR